MLITEGMELYISYSRQYVVNVETGALNIAMETGGAESNIVVEEPSTLLFPGGATLTFTLNGDTATITEL